MAWSDFDPTAVRGPAETESDLRDLREKLEAQTDALHDLFRNAANAEVTYKVEYAKALLRAEGGTVAEREANALLEVENDDTHLLTDRRVAEAVADAARESVRSLRDQLSAAQSENANVRFRAGL